ncbi:hypothetical protein PTTG_01315 [Puccinia triticina 1-1 BBBD Race 1]|uniref:Uncharacterized protein n=1 Tax=Puccinia triticina (isolate 1-1 / race 1 (BBBD)) TaxID=630390 RepID=A0A180GZ35_PUCT1|nr:hypothetical protein PTTG_01315 [Puccinia triticina 1-1 BBBD Race 1]
MNESHHPTPQAFSDQNNPRAPNLRLETADSVSVPLPDLFQSSDLGSRNPPRSLPARLPTPNIDPAPVIPTSVEPDTAIKKAKYPLTPPDMMEMFAKKTLKELRDLQHTHIAYRRLNQAIKLEAQKLYFDYQHKQHLLSLKYRRPFRLLTKYLGQRRTRQKKTNWHKFQQTNPSAQDALHNTEVNIGQRNKQVSVIYKQSNLNASCGDVVESNVNTGDDPVSSKDNIFDKKPKSSAKIQAEIKAWAAGVQLKLKELSDLCGVEGFLVLAGQDHRKPFFFQGGSMHGDTFLRALIDEGDPMREFAIWTAGTKKVNKKRKATAKSPASFPSDGCIGQPVWKKLKVSAFENQDVCQADLRSNQKYIATEFGKMYTEIQKNSTKKDTRGWPGTDTASRLAVFNHKLVVKENNIGLSAEHIENVPVKKINLETCWLILRGLKNNWIELVEHHFDVCRKKSSAPKRKGTKISATPHSDFFEDEFDNDHDNHGEDEEQGTDDEDGADHEEDEEDEDDEDDKDDEEDEEDEDDEDDDE